MTEYHIQNLGHHGDGIAKGPVYAPVTLPGEVVTGTLEGQTLRDVRIVTSSGDRVAPPCRHFKSCGGCQLQHASDAFVADWKVQIVASALKAHGLETDFRPIHTSLPQSRRRATFTARRTKKAAMAGFYARASDVVVEVPDCQLLHPDLRAVLPVAELLAQLGTSRKAALAVTATVSENGLDVAVAQGKPLDGPLRLSLAQVAEQAKLARLCWGDEVIALREPPFQQFGEARVVPPPGAFLQATRDGETALLTAVRAAVGDAARIVDLFAGCGTFSLPLAQNAQVHAVEGIAEMVTSLETGWRQATGLKPVTGEARDLFRRPLLVDELSPYGAIVLDPPRAGAERQVNEIAKADVFRLAYVSCNPTTFARDVRVLVDAGYSLDWVQVVDQFRWSTHVELAAALSR